MGKAPSWKKHLPKADTGLWQSPETAVAVIDPRLLNTLHPCVTPRLAALMVSLAVIARTGRTAPAADVARMLCITRRSFAAEVARASRLGPVQAECRGRTIVITHATRAVTAPDLYARIPVSAVLNAPSREHLDWLGTVLLAGIKSRVDTPSGTLDPAAAIAWANALTIMQERGATAHAADGQVWVDHAAPRLGWLGASLKHARIRDVGGYDGGDGFDVARAVLAAQRGYGVAWDVAAARHHWLAAVQAHVQGTEHAFAFWPHDRMDAALAGTRPAILTFLSALAEDGGTYRIIAVENLERQRKRRLRGKPALRGVEAQVVTVPPDTRSSCPVVYLNERRIAARAAALAPEPLRAVVRDLAAAATAGDDGWELTSAVTLVDEMQLGAEQAVLRLGEQAALVLDGDLARQAGAVLMQAWLAERAAAMAAPAVPKAQSWAYLRRAA